MKDTEFSSYMEPDGPEREPGEASTREGGRTAEAILASPFRSTLLALLCVFPLVIYIFVDLPPRSHIVLSALLVAAGVTVAYGAPHYRLAIVFLSVAASLRYMLYRATDTLNFDNPADLFATGLLFIAELYALATLIVGYFQTAVIRRNDSPALDLTAPDLPTVDVFIPTFSEDLDVLRPTIAAAMAMDYPRKRVWVLDDGKVDGASERGRPEVEALAAELGAGYFRRPDNKGFKAGNVNNALKFTDGDLIAFFDADHVPVRSFLKRTVGFFLEDQKVALVQTPHHFYNPDPFERNLHLTGRVPSEQHLFYHGIQLGNDFWNSAFFCGSCAVIRRSAMVEVGGMSEDTVTEDAHTAMKMHSRGWRSVYLDVPLAAGLATESYAVHVKQRTRWARGMAQIFRKDNPLIKRGLSLAQRLNYFNASWHFFFGVPRLIFMIMPSLYLVFDFHPLSADVREVLVYAIPHLILAGLGAATINRNVRHSFWPEVYELAVAPYAALVTAWAVVSPESGAFNPTAKGGTESGYRFDWRKTWFLLLVVAMVVAGLIYTPFKISAHPFEQDTIIVAAVWNFYNLVILSAAVAAAYESPQKRKHHRVSRPARVILKSDPRLPEPITAHRAEPTGEAINLSMGGAAFRVPGRVVVPDTFGLQIESPYGRTPTLPCERIESTFQGDHTVVRCSFASEMGGEKQRELTLQIFSASDSWVHDRYSYDRPLVSLKNVLLAPFSAFLQAPGWVQSAMTPSTRVMGPLVPGAVASRCASCGAPLAPSERECEACGAVVAEVDEFAMMAQTGPQLPAPLNLQPAARSRFWVVVPALLVIFAVALGAGYSPVVAALSRYMPLQKWERVTHRTRGHELNLAYEQLRLLEAELVSASQGASLPLDWRSRLWGIRRDFHLYGNDPSRPDLDGVAGHLDQSVRFMDSAEEELRRGLSPDVIRPRLEAVDQKLDLVAELLGLPR